MLGCCSAAIGRPLHPVVRFSSRSLPSPQLSMPLSSQTRLRGIHFPFLQLKYGSPLHSDWLKPDRHRGWGIGGLIKTSVRDSNWKSGLIPSYLVWRRWSHLQSQLLVAFPESPALGSGSFLLTVLAGVDSYHTEAAQEEVSSYLAHHRTGHKSQRDKGHSSLHQTWTQVWGWEGLNPRGTLERQGPGWGGPLVANCRPGRSGSETGPCL